MRRFVTKRGESWSWGRAGDVGMRCGGQRYQLKVYLERLEITVQLCMGHLGKPGAEKSRSHWNIIHAGDGNILAACSHLVIVNMSTPEAFRASSNQRSYSSSHSFTSYVHSQEENTPKEMLGIRTFRHIAQQG